MKDKRQHKGFIVAGIKNLLKRNYKIDLYTVGVHSLVDGNLDFRENWENIKTYLFIPEPPAVICPHCGEFI